MRIHWLSPDDVEILEKQQSKAEGDFCFKSGGMPAMRVVCLDMGTLNGCGIPKRRGQFCVGVSIRCDEKGVHVVGPGRLVVVEVDPETQGNFSKESKLMTTPSGLVTNAIVGCWACGYASSPIVNGKCAMFLAIFPVQPERDRT